MINNLLNQTEAAWSAAGAQCEPLGPRPTPRIVGQSIKDDRATLAVMLCQSLGAAPAAISQATGVGEDTRRLIAERKTEDSKRLERAYKIVRRCPSKAKVNP